MVNFEINGFEAVYSMQCRHLFMLPNNRDMLKKNIHASKQALTVSYVSLFICNWNVGRFTLWAVV